MELKKVVIGVLLIGVLLLTACGPVVVKNPIVPDPTITPTVVPVLAATATPEPTSTSLSGPGQIIIANRGPDGNLVVRSGLTVKIEPNPYTGKDSLTVVDNGDNDASFTYGEIALVKCPLGTYTVTEINAPEGSPVDKDGRDITLDLGKPIATVLYDIDWVFPAKINLDGYRWGMVIVYSLRIHNGSPDTQTFVVTAEPNWNAPDDTAIAPKELTQWVTFGQPTYPVEPYTTKDVQFTFVMPEHSYFVSITRAGVDWLKVPNNPNPPLTLVQREILKNFATNTSNTQEQIAAAKWGKDIKALEDFGLLRDGKKWEYLTVVKRSNNNFIQTANAVRLIFTMGE